MNTRRVEAVILKGVELRAGDRVKIQPKHDEIFSNVSLTNKIGVIEAFQQDAERRIYVSLVLERDRAESGAPPHHLGERFLFTLDEIEPV